MSETTKKHKTQAPKKLNFAIFICSTSRHQKLQKHHKVEDASGDLIETLLKNAGHTILLRKTIPDHKPTINKSIQDSLNTKELDAIIFSGGTGITQTDITIETITPHLDKTLPGFGELFRHLSFNTIGTATILTRAIAGTAKGRALFCIPGSPDAVKLCLERLILPEAPHIVKHARE